MTIDQEDWQCTRDGCDRAADHPGDHEPGMCECGQDMDAHSGGWCLLAHDRFMEFGNIDRARLELHPADERIPRHEERAWVDGPLRSGCLILAAAFVAGAVVTAAVLWGLR